MPNGGSIHIIAHNIIIDSKSELGLEAGNYVYMSISDEGTGIPEQYIDKVFDPFFTTKRNGTGLGLAIAYSVIMEHKGKITIKSEVNKGTIIDIYLPASTEKEINRLIAKSKIIKGEGSILLMDDEEVLRKTCEEMLYELGYTVVTTSNGEEAIAEYARAKISKVPFDLVILDITVPGVNVGGRETLKNLIKIDPSIKAIAISGYLADEIMENPIKYGFLSALPKPFNIEAFSQVIYNALTPKF